MKFRILFIILSMGLSAATAHAADLVGVSQLFRQTFWSSHYQERFCGLNIEKLVRKAQAANLNLSGASILKITDPFGYTFGLVSAVQAREAGRLMVPARVKPERAPGKNNWEFHVVLLIEGKILDYDFTNEPRILSAHEYFNYMFIPREKMTDLNYRQNKLKSFRVTTYPATEYISRLDQRLGITAIEKESKLAEFLPKLFN